MMPLAPKKAAALALVVALSAGGAYAALSRGVRVTTVVAEKKDLEHRIVASGRVLAPSRVTVSATASGLVVSVGAELGQHVDTGKLLVQIDDKEARAQLAQAAAAVEQARARVSQLRSVGAVVANQSLTQAQTNLDKAQADYDRTQKLAAQGAVAAVELDTVKRALELAKAQRAAAEAQSLGSSPTGADTRVTSSALLQAEAQRAGAEVRLSQLRILATSPGTVLTRAVEPGDVVQPGRALFTIAADGDEQLTFQADERNLSAIALGQKALASADAFPNESFEAETSYIAPSIDPQRGTVEVRLRVPKPPKYLLPDMTVSIDLLVASKKDVLVVPTEAVRGAATPTPWVLAVEGGKAHRRDVKLGITGEGTTEIVSGLEPGTELVVPDGRVVPEGKRVTATRKEP
ncbi:MAG: efflux RND transporter periplasmic adaptor subunit [Myxococcales bacterium]|nr:efflux RND transporter periplasmic adaptor subunit [Myxococcales bacterium]